VQQIYLEIEVLEQYVRFKAGAVVSIEETVMHLKKYLERWKFGKATDELAKTLKELYQ
jgi:hypothetical protein